MTASERASEYLRRTAVSATFPSISSIKALSKPRWADSLSARALFGYKQPALASVVLVLIVARLNVDTVSEQPGRSVKGTSLSERQEAVDSGSGGTHCSVPRVAK